MTTVYPFGHLVSDSTATTDVLAFGQWFEAAGGDTSADVPPGLVEVLALALDADKSASVGVGLVEVLAITPATQKSASVGVGLVRVSAGQVTASKSVALALGETVVTAYGSQSLAPADDAAWDNVSLWDESADVTLYSVQSFGAQVFKSWYRFVGLQATPARAMLRLTIAVAVSGPFKANFFGDDAASSPMPTDATEAAGRSLTSASASVDEAVVAGQVVEVDVTDIVQAVASLPGFDGTLSIVGVSTQLFANVQVYTNEGVSPPELTLYYPSVSTLKTAGLQPAPVEVLGVEVGTLGLTGDVPPGLVEVLAPEVGADKSASVGVGLAEVSALEPTTQKAITLDVGLVVVLGLEPFMERPAVVCGTLTLDGAEALLSLGSLCGPLSLDAAVGPLELSDCC